MGTLEGLFTHKPTDPCNDECPWYGFCHCGCGAATEKIGPGEYAKHTPEHESTEGQRQCEKCEGWFFPQGLKNHQDHCSGATPKRRQRNGPSADEMHQRAVALYNGLSDYSDGYGEVDTSIVNVLRDEDKHLFSSDGEVSYYKVRQTLHYLVEIGSVRTRGPRIKVLVEHPDQTPVDTTMPARTDIVRVIPDPEPDLMSRVNDVPTELLADALAQQMWQRYEWALTEVGNLSERVNALEAENERLRSRLSDVPEPGLSEVAQRLLADLAANRK